MRGLSSATIEAEFLVPSLTSFPCDSVDADPCVSCGLPEDYIEGEIVCGKVSNDDWLGCFVACLMYLIFPCGTFVGLV